MSKFDERVQRLVDKHNYPLNVAYEVVWREVTEARNASIKV